MNRSQVTIAALVAAALVAGGVATAQQRADRATLRTPQSFATVPDQRARSVEIFREAGKVIQHPRCVNCHPATDVPLQGADMHPHSPPVVRGAAGMGTPGMPCTTCHGPTNAILAGTSLKSMPGHPAWHLAPIEMAWAGKSLGEICRQIKDPARNGGKSLAALHEHMAQDSLVGWGWNPGPGREATPGTQEAFGLLIKAWIDTGAECPA